METRGQIKQRLKAKGQWQEFVQLRALFKAEGLEPREARQAALVELELMYGRDEAYYQRLPEKPDVEPREPIG